MGSVKLEEMSSIELNMGNVPYHPNEGFKATVTLPDTSGTLNITGKDDASFNLSTLHSIYQRHPWKNHMPSYYCHNTWIMSIDEEEPITVGGSIDTLNYSRKTENHK